MKRSTRNRADKRRENRKEILTRLVFSKFYSLKGVDLKRAIEILSPYKGQIAAELAYLKEKSRSLGWEIYNKKGVDTYGYESEEQILGDLQYISDRFTDEFRLRWVLDLIDRGFEFGVGKAMERNKVAL